MDNLNISFRPIAECDRNFLSAVYASTRAEELNLLDWDDQQKAAFLDMQFSAQHQYYQEHYKDTDFLVINRDDKPIGRLYIAHWQDEIRIVDLAILPEYRNAGTGTRILEDVQAEAAAVKKSVRIHVERFNPAQNLYRRLGFVKTGEQGVYNLMEWTNNL